MAGNKSSQRYANRGKKLIDRITPLGGTPSQRSPSREGFKVVNGRLVGANDVGALLREASLTVEARKKHKFHKKPRGHPTPKGNKKSNRLVISTDSIASNKILVLYNLAVGVNQESLKIVLQKLSHAHINRVKIEDLPSGSATANVWLSHPTLQELERVKRLFDGALVDGRTIKVVTVPDQQTMSY